MIDDMSATIAMYVYPTIECIYFLTLLVGLGVIEPLFLISSMPGIIVYAIYIDQIIKIKNQKNESRVICI